MIETEAPAATRPPVVCRAVRHLQLSRLIIVRAHRSQAARDDCGDAPVMNRWHLRIRSFVCAGWSLSASRPAYCQPALHSSALHPSAPSTSARTCQRPRCTFRRAVAHSSNSVESARLHATTHDLALASRRTLCSRALKRYSVMRRPFVVPSPLRVDTERPGVTAGGRLMTVGSPAPSLQSYDARASLDHEWIVWPDRYCPRQDVVLR